MTGVIKTVILTGCRREEAVGMRWDEIDMERGIWTLPPVRTKNGAGHTIFLSVMMMNLLCEMRLVNGQSAFVFASSFEPESIDPDEAGDPDNKSPDFSITAKA